MDAAVVFLPLLGAVIAGLFGRRLGDRLAHAVTVLPIGIAALLSGLICADVTLMGGQPRTTPLLTWFSSGGLEIGWAVAVDSLTAVMMVVVTWISFLVHVYSIGYMRHDPSVPRFMSFLSLFTFAMLVLVTADNLVQLFFGWEGVGLASYLLIGFWYAKPSAAAAAIKAFVVNRIGDFAFLLGLFGLYLLCGSLDFATVFAVLPLKAETAIPFLGQEVSAVTVIALLLFVGAMGKSAQFGLHVWLPDAMEGPTPVSALIHAATMVTAGVFLLARLSPLFELSDVALAVVVAVGAFTALFAATVACVQNDIKRVIAYSTCSQLGYMFVAIGVSAYQAGIFHLFTHAFFKSLLFLGAGSVIHAMSDEQDIRRMGGLWRHIPLTYALMLVGSLALAGIWPFAGYWSKDFILEAAWGAGTTLGMLAYGVGVLTALLTAFYSGRLLLLAFHGAPRADEKVMAHIHESPAVMTGPLFLLAMGALFAGALGYHFFVGEDMAAFWGGSIQVLSSHPALAAAHGVPEEIVLAPSIAAGAGVALALLMYGVAPALPVWMARVAPGIYRFLANKWYVDALYDRLFVRPAFALGRFLWKMGDETVIDGLGPNGAAFLTRILARRTALLQSGAFTHYAFAMLVGVVVLTTWYVLGMGGVPS